MKRVYLLRHGKTEKTSESGEDFDRRLKTKGEEDVRAVAVKLADEGIHIDRIYSSSAVRAITSAQIAAESLASSAPEQRDELYQAEKEDYLELLRSLDRSTETVIIVGHNPTLEETAEGFLGKHREIGTAHIMWLEFDCDDWSQLSFESPVIRSGLIIPL